MSNNPTSQKGSAMTVVAKMSVAAVEDYGHNQRIKLSCVYDGGINKGEDPENRSFTKATPWGECTMSIDNPYAVAQFRLAKPAQGDEPAQQASTHYVLFIDASKNSLEDVMTAAAQLR
jgi:hypothetical protein